MPRESWLTPQAQTPRYACSKARIPNCQRLGAKRHRAFSSLNLLCLFLKAFPGWYLLANLSFLKTRQYYHTNQAYQISGPATEFKGLLLSRKLEKIFTDFYETIPPSQAGQISSRLLAE